MNYRILSDVAPETNTFPEVPHERENWESPLMDKFNSASEYLKSIKSDAVFHCEFNSHVQIFTPLYKSCNGMSKEEIDNLIQTINSL